VSNAPATDLPIPTSELAFNFRSGRLCLAFVATVGERWRGGFERLRRPPDLGRWYVESGLLAEEIPVTSADLASARELREAIHRHAKRVVDGRPGSRDDEGLMTEAASHPDLVPVLRHGAMTRVPPARGAARAALSTVARDAIDMFATVDPARLRECASPECGLLFVDTSRPGRRRWCSSDACGGQARSAAYRSRSRTRTH
jgi:predicted RNA-binding Zn ribbon-like protein